MKKAVIAVFALTFVLAPLATAATYEGDLYFNLDGSWEREKLREGGKETMWNIGGGLEYFVTKEISVGPSAGYSRDKRDNGKWTQYALGIDGKYHFNTDAEFVPYVGGFIDYAREKMEGDKFSGTIYGPLVGAKWFITENTHFFGQYEYRKFSSDLKDEWKNENAIVIGVAFKFN